MHVWSGWSECSTVGGDNRSCGDTVIIISTQQRGPFWLGGGGCVRTHRTPPPPPGYGPVGSEVCVMLNASFQIFALSMLLLSVPSCFRETTQRGGVINMMFSFKPKHRTSVTQLIRYKWKKCTYFHFRSVLRIFMKLHYYSDHNTSIHHFLNFTLPLTTTTAMTSQRSWSWGHT